MDASKSTAAAGGAGMSAEEVRKMSPFERKETLGLTASPGATASAAADRRAAEEAALIRRMIERDEARRLAMAAKAADLTARTKSYMKMSPAERRKADFKRE